MNIDKLASHLLTLVESASPEVLDLFLKNQPLAHHLALRSFNGYNRRGAGTMGSYDEEDFAQEALLALYQAAENYDPTVGAKFSTLAHNYITNALHRLVKAGEAKKRAIVSTDLDTPLNDEGGEEGGDMTYLDTVGDPKTNHLEDKFDSDDTLKQAIAQVTGGDERAQRVLSSMMELGDQFTLQAAGDEHGVTKTYIQTIVNKYVPKLKKLLNQKGLGGYDDRGTMLPASSTRPGEYQPAKKKGPFRGTTPATSDALTANESVILERLIRRLERA